MPSSSSAIPSDPMTATKMLAGFKRLNWSSKRLLASLWITTIPLLSLLSNPSKALTAKTPQTHSSQVIWTWVLLLELTTMVSLQSLFNQEPMLSSLMKSSLIAQSSRHFLLLVHWELGTTMVIITPWLKKLRLLQWTHVDTTVWMLAIQMQILYAKIFPTSFSTQWECSFVHRIALKRMPTVCAASYPACTGDQPL